MADEVGGRRRTIAREALQREPHRAWNAFVELLAMEDAADLSPLQRQAQLVFWYDAEVQNGGHGQYLENRGVAKLSETVAALRALGLPAQADILASAAAALAAGTPQADWADTLDDTFIACLDEAFFRAEPTVTAALEAHLAANSRAYLKVE